MATETPTMTGQSTAIWTLPRQDVSVPTARHLVRARLRLGQMAPETVDTALLLLTELLTNAVRHTHGPHVTFAVGLSPERLTLKVTDNGNGTHGPRHQRDALSESGRGLDIVTALATACGTRNTAAGHTVWATIRL